MQSVKARALAQYSHGPMAHFAGMGDTPGAARGSAFPRAGGIVMITFVRTATIAPGKFAEAMGYAHQIAKVVEKITGHKVGVSIPIGGNPFRVAWVLALPDLASVESSMGKLLGDAEYVQPEAAGASLFLPGSAHDEMWRGV
jgi:hypothetical protein